MEQHTLENEVSLLKKENKWLRTQLQELEDTLKQVVEAVQVNYRRDPQDQVQQSCGVSSPAVPSTLVSTDIDPPGRSLHDVFVVQATEAHKLQQQQTNFQRGEKEHNEMQIRITVLEKEVDTFKKEVNDLRKMVEQLKQEQSTQDEKNQQKDNDEPEEGFDDEEKEGTAEVAEIKHQPHVQGTKTYWVWQRKGPNCVIIQTFILEKPVIKQGQVLEYEVALDPVDTRGFKLVVDTVIEGITHKVTSPIDEVDADAASGGVNIGSFLQVEVFHAGPIEYIELRCSFSGNETTDVVKLALDLEQNQGKLWREDIG